MRTVYNLTSNFIHFKFNFSIKIKSKNKLIYGFGNGQSLQINPSNINNKITYHRTPFSYFEIKRDSVLYGFKLDF